MGFAMAMPLLLLLKNVGNDFHEEESKNNVCLVMFTNICKKVTHFWVCD
jgi:hypothetical protein